MYPSRNPFFNGNSPFNRGQRSRSTSFSSGRSFQSPASILEQGLLSGPSQNQAEASRPILGRKDTDDQFPVDTVNRIFNDIEKLFVDESNSPPSTPVFDARVALQGFPANQSFQGAGNGVSLNSSESSHTTEQYINLCSNELIALDALLSENGDNKILGKSIQTILGGDSYLLSPYLPQLISKGSFDSLTTVNSMSLNGLHTFIYRIFLLHDKLQAFIQMNSHTAFSQSMNGEQSINEIFEKWYSIGINLKDRLIAMNSFPELSLTLAAFQPKQLAKLWRLTRILRNFVWMRKNPAASTSVSSNGFSPNQTGCEHQYLGSYGKLNNYKNCYFGK